MKALHELDAQQVNELLRPDLNRIHEDEPLKRDTMKKNTIYTIYGLAFLAFVGCGWSLAENPTDLKGIITAACFIALYLGAKVVNNAE